MINVYWTGYSENGTISPFDFKEPSPALGKVNSKFKNLGIEHNFSFCPAFTKLYENTFALTFPNDYELTLDNNNLTSKLYDQRYYDEMVYLRSMTQKLVSYNLRYLFFSESSLQLSMLHNQYIDSKFSQNSTLIEGQFDIGQWFRPLDCAFIMNNSSVTMIKDEPYAIIKFHTTEKINLIQFYRTQNIINLQNDLYKTRMYKEKIIKPLDFFYKQYNKIKFTKLLSKEIENSIIGN